MSNKYEHLIVRQPVTVNELPDHDLSQVIPYPILMSKAQVPEANAWALYLYIKDISQAMKDIALLIDKATPHRHEFDEMYLLIGDEKAITFEIMLGDETYQVSTPGAVYVPRGTPHAIRPVDATVGLTGGLIPVCLNGEYITLPVE
jgi:mannose-6-phosphate isomerase-like protein (cupin superfamily)